MPPSSMHRAAFAGVLALVSAVSVAGSLTVLSGGDRFVATDDATIAAGSRRDLFAAGFRTRVVGDVAGDVHAAGFSTTVAGRVGDDLYAVGGSVSLGGEIGGDASAAGFEVSFEEAARVGGNLRASAGTLLLAAPVAGGVIASGGVIELDAPIAGDARLAGSEITFGERATIGGTLVYSAPSPIDVPVSVAPPERVRYERSAAREGDGDNEIALPELRPSVGTALLSALGTLLLLSVIAALALGLAGERVERLRARADAAPWRALALGFVGLSALIGAVPVAAATLVGLPLVPLLLLALVALWTLGYLLGVHVLVQRLAASFGGRGGEGVPGRLALLVLGIAGGALLNFIPIVGWLLNVAILLLGLGTMTVLAIDRLAGVIEPRRLTRDRPEQEEGGGA